MEEAFKDCNWDKQGLLPCSDVMEEIEGVGRGRERKRSGRQSPEQGDTQMLADGMQRIAESKLHLAAWKHSAETDPTDPGRTFCRGRNSKAPFTESSPTPEGWCGGTLTAEDLPLPKFPA